MVIKKVKDKTLNLAKQMRAMREEWPNLSSSKKGKEIIWSGIFIPQKKEYQIEIHYEYPFSPKVWILKPQLRKNTPHLYADNHLCLYYPLDSDNMRWTKSKLISKTIVPWICEWIFCYELWCLSGKWIGIEFQHTGQKILDL